MDGAAFLELCKVAFDERELNVHCAASFKELLSPNVEKRDYEIVCFMEDVVEDGGSALHAICVVLQAFPSCKRFIGALYLVWKKKRFAIILALDFLLPPSDKFKGFELNVHVDMDCMYQVRTGCELVWIVVPFEGAVPFMSPRSKLFDLLRRIRGRYDGERCIFVPNF